MSTSATPLPHPGVRYPPPLAYVAGLLVGRTLERLRPLPITAPHAPARTAMAAALVLVALALLVSALATFRRAHTTLVPNRPATAFVTSGPYRFTRNPMYVGLATLYLAIALALNGWWAVALLPLVLLAIRRTVIDREERYLLGAFPESYAAYQRRVPRWL